MMNLKEKLLIFILLLSCGLLIWVLIYAMTYESKSDKRNWNNGHCKCGGEWEFCQAVGHNTSTNYLYKCPNCEAIIELYKYH